MATKHVYGNPSSTADDDTDFDAEPDIQDVKFAFKKPKQEEVEGDEQEEEIPQDEEDEDEKPLANNVLNILQRLPSSLIRKKPQQEFRCITCSEDYPSREELYCHLIHHVSLPSVVLEKLPSDDEDTAPSDDDAWSDEEEAPPPTPAAKTPQKIDISQLLKNPNLSLKKPVPEPKNADSALNKLSGLGFTIKKNTTPVKNEPEEKSDANSNDLIKKLGNLGGIKLKLKSDGNNANTFKVINGLKDFNASDEDEEGSGNDDSKEDQNGEEDQDKSGEHDGSGFENESDGENEQSPQTSRKNSESEEEKVTSAINRKLANSLKNLKGKVVHKEPPKSRVAITYEGQKNSPPKEVQPPRKPGRPTVKQTPKRAANMPVSKEAHMEQGGASPMAAAHERVSEQDILPSTATDTSMENVVVKNEVETIDSHSSNVPLFSGQIKSERTSPTPEGDTSTPILTRIKTEPDLQTNGNQLQPLVSNTTPLLPVAKTESQGMTIIEINGDSNDEDDDCCVVSSTPAPDIKPKVEYIAPKVENPPSYPSYQTTQPSFSSTTTLPSYSSATSMPSMLSGRLLASTTAKQHSFNWNPQDSKPPLDMLEKSADDIFESLLSGSTKKESLSEASEYISIDNLGPQHSCEVCNTRFTDISLLDDHRRMTGHASTLVPVSSSTMIPYNPASNLLSSLLPVKQIADQVGKLSTISGSGPGFTHQQNVMINIQTYPGATGGMMPPQYGAGTYSGQSLPPDYSQTQNMYGAPGQMPGQYPGQNYMGQHGAYGQQYPGQPPMSKPGYPSSGPAGQFPPSSSPYSSASPLQSMQQAVYGQAPMGTMGPPNAFAPSSSPSSMKPPTSSGVKIQNVQTFPPGQVIGNPMMQGQTGGMMTGHGPEMGGQPTAPQVIGQMNPPNQIRMAPGATISRPRMVGPRGPRPVIRPGLQVHGQMRGKKPGMRMAVKRPGQMTGGPGQKRRPDMLLPGKHDNEDCQVMAMQKQREGLPMIQSIQGAKDKLNLGSQISITKKPVNREANAMANVLASRGISVKQKQKSRSPTPERPIPHIPNLGAGMSIKHTSKSSNFSIPEAKVGGGMLSCKICNKIFMNQSSLSIHMTNAHGQTKAQVFKCDECPASYPKSFQLQHHKRVFHNVSGPNRELGLPVVDLSQEETVERLSNLGIYSFIPLANREQANGCFGIPIISVHNAQNGYTKSLQALGADGLLSLGPLKPLPNS